MQTQYIIYKTTNLMNGKIYIGQHQTNNIDDGYLGSGVAITAAVAKYGKENFSKEVLFTFDNINDMNAKEIEIVTEDFVSREDTYNVSLGGHGSRGFTLSEKAKRKCAEVNLGVPKSMEQRRKMSEAKKGKRKVISCPHCGISSKSPVIYRHHFDNCINK